MAEFSCNNERFIKIGITTTNGINERFGKTHRGYQISSICEKHMLMENASKIETTILEAFSTFKYVPIVKFGGYTECFTINTKDDILECITKKMK